MAFESGRKVCPIPNGFQLERLNQLSAAAFCNLTFRAYQYLLYQLHETGSVIAIGAVAEGRTAGLVIGETGQDKSAIISICVDTAYRNRGLGSALLLAMEKEFLTRAAVSPTFTYVTGKPTTPALERMLAKCGWPAPQPKHLVCVSDKRMYSAPWMREYQLPPSFELLPWTEITDRDRTALTLSQERENWVPKSLWPFDYEGTLETANSLAIRFKGELVGWVLTQPREPDSVCYCCSYMHPSLQRTSALVAAYADAVRRQIEFTNKPNGIWIVPFQHRSMVAFVRRRMAPYLISQAEFRQTQKRLESDLAEESRGATQVAGGNAC